MFNQKKKVARPCLKGDKRYSTDSLRGKGLLSRDIPLRNLLPLDRLFAYHDTIFGVLVSSGFTPRQAEVIMLILRMQLFYGSCFASAERLGRNIGVCEKTVDRLVKKLEEMGLLLKKRRKRLNGTLGTNILDLRPLVKLIVEAWGRLLSIPKEFARFIRQRVTTFKGGCSIKWSVLITKPRLFFASGEGWVNLKIGCAQEIGYPSLYPFRP
jgi:biotin operon repressor